jgi:ATP-dependent exoDNAse (exonuclease V) beta subunit
MEPDPKHENIIWCRTAQEPFNELDFLPIRYSSLKNTIFSNYHFDEKLQTYMDNLNLLYVAFTRACDNLFVFAPVPKKENRWPDTTGNLICQAIQNPVDESKPDNTIDLMDHWNKIKSSFTFGSLGPPEMMTRENDKNILWNEFPTFPVKKKLKQKYDHTDFFDLTETPERKTIQTGTMLHQLFANMITKEDVDKALSKMMFEGKISLQEKNEWILKINALFNDKLIASWFSKEWTVKTEADILLRGGKMKRPDRVLIKGNTAVVIDFKFGSKKHKRYDTQVKEYMKTLINMGYSDTSGFLWFVEQNRIEKVQINETDDISVEP